MTTIKESRDDLFKIFKRLYYQSNVKGLFKISPESHDKIAYRLTYLEIEDYFFKKPQIYKFSGEKCPTFKTSALTLLINSATFLLAFMKYTMVSLLFRLKIDSYPHPFLKNDKVRYLFLNSAGGVDRLKYAIPNLIESDECLIYYFFTSNTRKIFKRFKKDPTMRFVAARAPNVKAIRGGLEFLFSSGILFISRLMMFFDNLPLLDRIKIAAQISQYLYSLIIYHSWAEKLAHQLSAGYPDAIFIFDIDEEGKELMLADALKRLKKKTLVIQHGILTFFQSFQTTSFFQDKPYSKRPWFLNLHQLPRFFFYVQTLHLKIQFCDRALRASDDNNEDVTPVCSNFHYKINT